MRFSSITLRLFVVLALAGWLTSSPARAQNAGPGAPPPAPAVTAESPDSHGDWILEVAAGPFLGFHQGLVFGGGSGALRILYRTAQSSYWGLMLEPAFGGRGEGSYLALGLVGYRYQARYVFLDLLPLISLTDICDSVGDPEEGGCSNASFQASFKARVGAVLRWRFVRLGISLETMLGNSQTIGAQVFLGVGF
ncbi:hypothetical protein KJ975_11785 [Myxococcota bacterium]|nr:hypothetical protein [Myxococcota bacterium]